MDVVEFRTGPLATSGDDVRMVIKSCGFAVIVNREPLGHNPGAWLHLVPNEPLDALPIDCLDATKADPAKLVLGITLHRHKHRCFAFRPTPTGSFFFSAHMGFIDCHPPDQTLATAADHHPAKFLQPPPRRLITAESAGNAQVPGTPNHLLNHNQPPDMKP